MGFPNPEYPGDPDGSISCRESGRAEVAAAEEVTGQALMRDSIW